MPVSINGNTGITFPDGSVQPAAASPLVLRNRIINGDMRIDQRNAGASKTITDTANATYTLDRWFAYGSQASKFSVQQNAGSVTPPTGFTNYAGMTSLSAYTVGASELFQFCQRIEGFNFADLGWGTANAQTVTLSFWVRSSLTGTFGGALLNNAGNRSYPFSYSISAANTWEQKSITIAGDTSGTWLTTNGAAVNVNFSLGTGSTLSGTAGSWSGSALFSATGATSVVGTNGATWYVTGVQLEQNTSATPFERRLYNQELANCYRYYYRYKATGAGDFFGVGQCFSSTQALIATQFPAVMRSSPSALEQSGTASDYRTTNSTSTLVACSSVPTFNSCSAIQATTIVTVASGLTAGNSTLTAANTGTNGYLGWSAEL
jgi:hypothetical protein